MLPREAAALIAHARKLELPLEGLMCIPPVDDDAAPHFAFLAKLAREHGLSNLSMGMSGDFELAVKFGATHVRVGTAIFGARAPHPSMSSSEDIRPHAELSKHELPIDLIAGPKLPDRRQRIVTGQRHAALGVRNNSGLARCRKMALPLPGTTGSSL